MKINTLLHHPHKLRQNLALYHPPLLPLLSYYNRYFYQPATTSTNAYSFDIIAISTNTTLFIIERR